MNNFTIVNKIGEGAYSQVFKVRRVSDQKIYALKKVKMGKLTEKEKSNALNEVRILASIEQENIISYKESFFDDASSSLCLVMEYADGGDLQEMIDHCKKSGTSISEEKCWSYLTQAVVALKTLHALNIVHRDIKSANFFLTSNGNVKLGDLNVSKVARKGSLLITQTGTPYYACPEVWQDKPYDAKSDIWSLGCVLYEMAALQPPFRANDMNGLGKKVCEGRVPMLPLSYSKELNNIVKMCLQLTPRLRPNSQELLERCKKHAPDSAAAFDQNREHLDLLNTLKVPRLLNQIGACLPQANYESPQNSLKPPLGQRSSNQNLPQNQNLPPTPSKSALPNIQSNRVQRISSNLNPTSASKLGLIPEQREDTGHSKNKLNDYHKAKNYNYGAVRNSRDSTSDQENQNHDLKSPLMLNNHNDYGGIVKSPRAALRSDLSLIQVVDQNANRQNQYRQNYNSLVQSKALRNSGAAILNSPTSATNSKAEMKPAFASPATQENSRYQQMLQAQRNRQAPNSQRQQQFVKGDCYQILPNLNSNGLHTSDSPHQKMQGNNSKIADAAAALIHSDRHHYQANVQGRYGGELNLPVVPSAAGANSFGNPLSNRYNRY